MENYQLLEILGSGTFGEVRSAVHKPTGEMVAVKRLNRYSGLLMEPEFECYCVSKLKHPNIVEFRDRFWDSNSDDLCFVFELMDDGSLLDVMEKRPTMFTEPEIRKICYQILKGLDYMHNNGYFHLDLKPENVLVKAGDVKIGDLGSARKINSSEPLEAYVTTRYYRAPEVMLESPCYGPKVDMWAVGLIMAELFKLSPLFPGRNQADQMYRICSVIGTPTFSSWPEGFILAERANYQFPMLQGGGLSTLIPSASESAVKLISWLLSWDPSRRPTPAQALQHEFFVGSYRIPRAIDFKPAHQIARTDLNVLPRFQPTF